MDSLKQKFNALKIEENDLSEELSNIDAEIRKMKALNDTSQYEIQSLISSEKLLKLKIESSLKRLSAIESQLKLQEKRLTSTPNEIPRSPGGEYSEEALEAELMRKREELCSLGAQYNETVIHLQQVQAERKRKEDRAVALESEVSKLEMQHSKIKDAWNKVDPLSAPGRVVTEDDQFEHLETQLRQFQQNLEKVTDTLDHSRREIVRLDRLIAGCKEDLAVEHRTNEALKKEFEHICSELESI